jgi:hypothetical protein
MMMLNRSAATNSGCEIHASHVLGPARDRPNSACLSLKTFDLTSSARTEEHWVTHITNASHLRNLLIRKTDGQKGVETFWWSENLAHEGSIGNQKTTARHTHVDMKFATDAQKRRRWRVQREACTMPCSYFDVEGWQIEGCSERQQALQAQAGLLDHILTQVTDHNDYVAF